MAGPTTLKFGKYVGKTFAQILEIDGKYLCWYRDKFLDPADIKNNGKYAKSNQFQINEINTVLAAAKGNHGAREVEDMGDTELPPHIQASIAKANPDELKVIKSLCEANQALLLEVLDQIGQINNKGSRVLS